MAKEAVVALVGAGAGPAVPIYERTAKIQVTGLTRGEIKVFNHGEKKHEVMRVDQDGSFPIPDGCAFLSAECQEAEDSLIVLVVRG